jgi:regulator of replication initiation timing
LKNRKSARKSRRRRKAELGSLREQIKALKLENEKLKQKLKDKDEDSVGGDEEEKLGAGCAGDQ